MKRYLLMIAVAVGAASFASAGVVTAYEFLNDPPPFDLDRDLSRTRWNDQGYFDVSNNEAAIVSENNVSNSFGVVSNNTVSYSHRLDWLTPPAGTFLSAELTIYAWGSVGDDDRVYLESNFVGTINATQLWDLGFTQTTFAGNDGVILDFLLGDGQLDIEIDKNVYGGLSNLNVFSIYGSKLEVSYVAVPEPSSMLFVLTAGVSSLLFLRRNRARRA